MQIKPLLDLLKLEPNNLSLYELALTHPSYNGDVSGEGQDYERLEFVGDAVVSLVVAELIFSEYPHFDQGMMSKTRAKLVQTEGLYRIAKELDLAAYVRIGHSISRQIVATSKKILENVFEALMGAIYIDQGFEVAKRIIKHLFFQRIKLIDVEMLTDYKTQLQEAIQAEHREAVTYIVDEEKGPAHDRRFTVSVSFAGTILGRGSGLSKKAAEQAAAADALKKKAV